MKNKLKKKYYHVHVNYGGDQGFSVMFEADWMGKPNKDDILAFAIDMDKIEDEDIEYADVVEEVTKKEFERFNK